MHIAAGQGQTDFIRHLLMWDQDCGHNAKIAFLTALQQGRANEIRAFSQLLILRNVAFSPLLLFLFWGRSSQVGCLIESYTEQEFFAEVYQIARAQDTKLLRRLVACEDAPEEVIHKVWNVFYKIGSEALEKDYPKALLSLVESGLPGHVMQKLLLQAVNENNPDAVRLLLSKALTIPDFPLADAAQCLNMAMFLRLTADMDDALDVGANREAGSEISSVLETSSTKKMVETIVTVLTEAGKKIGPFDGWSLLGTAIVEGNSDIIELVYQVTDDEDREAQMWHAVVHGRGNALKQLLECGEGFDNILSRAVQEKNTKVLETLSNMGISLGNRLHEAALRGEKESVEVFLAANIKLEDCAGEDGGEALYQIACQQREVAAMMVRHWQQQSADNSAENNALQATIDTAIGMAFSTSNVEVLNFLESFVAEDHPSAVKRRRISNPLSGGSGITESLQGSTAESDYA